MLRDWDKKASWFFAEAARSAPTISTAQTWSIMVLRLWQVKPPDDVSGRSTAAYRDQSLSAMPDAFRRKGARTDWADANRRGQPTDCFIEGPSFDTEGNLYVVDIPFGRIFKIAPDGEWSLTIEYDGWPNGLKIHPDGRVLVADYRHGIMELDAKAGRMQPVLTTRNSESFKGCNDLHIASTGEVYFTDQGQTGLHDPTGRVFRLSPNGRLDCLLDTGISPNGLVLDPTETVLFVAMTRDNAVWRLPFMKTAASRRSAASARPSAPAAPTA